MASRSNRTREYKSPEITVSYDPRRCIHAEECIHGLPGVFEKDRRPWIDPSQGEPAEIAEVVRKCPTGALHYELRDGEPERPAAENSGYPAVDGPIYLAGDLTISGAEGEMKETRIALCRCGASRHKPFCDNSHLDAGFQDPGALGDGRLVPAAEEPESGSLEIVCAANGPLVVKGPLTLRSADGTQTMSGVKGSLCRCGASKKKPYCDGSHAAIGFDAD